LQRLIPRGERIGFFLKNLSPDGSWLFEIARVLVFFDHVARFIVNANHGIM
jgi:hypothetical protein